MTSSPIIGLDRLQAVLYFSEFVTVSLLLTTIFVHRNLVNENGNDECVGVVPVSNTSFRLLRVLHAMSGSMEIKRGTIRHNIMFGNYYLLAFLFNITQR